MWALFLFFREVFPVTYQEIFSRTIILQDNTSRIFAAGKVPFSDRKAIPAIHTLFNLLHLSSPPSPSQQLPGCPCKQDQRKCERDRRKPDVNVPGSYRCFIGDPFYFSHPAASLLSASSLDRSKYFAVSLIVASYLHCTSPGPGLMTRPNFQIPSRILCLTSAGWHLAILAIFAASKISFCIILTPLTRRTIDLLLFSP